MNKVQESPNIHSIVTVPLRNERRREEPQYRKQKRISMVFLIIVVNNPKITKQVKNKFTLAMQWTASLQSIS